MGLFCHCFSVRPLFIPNDMQSEEHDQRAYLPVGTCRNGDSDTAWLAPLADDRRAISAFSCVVCCSVIMVTGPEHEDFMD